MLEAVDGSMKLEAADEEPDVQGDRLDLLAVVRGLEALDQPSRVTLLTPSQYVSRGMRFGLVQWRETGWQWERFGQFTPVKNRDLWQRIDRALDFHEVEVRTWRLDGADAETQTRTVPARSRVRQSLLQTWVAVRRATIRLSGRLKEAMAELACRLRNRFFDVRRSSVA